MAIDTWLAFCAIETVLCFTPGPAVIFVVSEALRGGLKRSLGASLGIVAANTLYFGLSATGIAAILIASRDVFLGMRWAGAAYLVWLGLRMMVTRGPSGTSGEPTGGQSFARGFLVQGANPKTLVFFGALLPAFIDPSSSIVRQFAVLAVSSVVIELCVLAIYARAAIQAQRIAGSRVVGALRRVGGGLLVASGVRIALVESE